MEPQMEYQREKDLDDLQAYIEGYRLVNHLSLLHEAKLILQLIMESHPYGSSNEER